mgnify:CR=1 FL=1
MKVNLAYGRGYLAVELPDDATVLEPRHQPGLPDERAALLEALERPIGARPLREWIAPGQTVCLLFTDLTRATPNHRLIPWLLDYLSFVPPEHITLLNQTGTHRPNTPAELAQMLTPEVVARYRVINHQCDNPAELVAVGTLHDGSPALLNRHAVQADVRIATGFIEPHLFAGFSGGPKALLPGVAGLQTVMTNHCASHISHPNATFGILDGNPLWEEIRDVALRVRPTFLVNVALNTRRQITGVFAGDLIQAHRVGCDFVKRAAMHRCEAPFDIVVTTNSGYPLDLNLYQGVKGMAAGVRILKPGGTLILACECCEGVPPGSPCDQLLRSARSPEHILELLAQPGFVRPEQWQPQVQALVQRKAEVLLYSSMPDDVVRAVHLTPCHDIAAAVRERLARLGPGARVAVLPQGPLNIPYLA